MEHLIWTHGREANEWRALRELHDVRRNEHGGLVFLLDGGEQWQFTPGDAEKVELPTLGRVDSLTIGRQRDGRLTGVSWVGLKEPQRYHQGHFTVRKPPESAEREAVDIRATLRQELNEHPLLSEITAKAEATQADILREAVNLYKRLSPDKSAVLAAYLDKGSITGAVKVTGFSRGKAHKLLLDIEREQGVQIIHRRRGLEGEHIGDSYRHNGRNRNRTHRAG